MDLIFNHSLITTAFNLAAEVHKGQTRKHSGDPYLTHPVAVSILAFNFLLNNPRQYTDRNHLALVCSVALCHDVIEDFEGDKLEIETELHSISRELYTSVRLLSHYKEKETYADYINKIIHSDNTTAKLVKLADLRHNIYTWPDKGSMLDKWHLAGNLIDKHTFEALR